MYQWDATSLITCAKFQMDARLVLDYVLDVATALISTEVYQETVDAGLAGGYPDANEIKARVDSGRIIVEDAPHLSDPFEEVLNLYGLSEGDKAVVRLSVQTKGVKATVTDDRLLFVVLHRCGHKALFLPDFVEKAVIDGKIGSATGKKLLLAVRPRLHIGFVEHSLQRLEGVI